MNEEYAKYRALWSAVLLTAVNDTRLRDVQYKKKSESPSEYRKWAKAWIRCDWDGPCTFNWVCDMLEVSPEALRQYALEHKPLRCDNLTNLRFTRIRNAKREL